MISEARRPQLWVVGGPNGAGKSTLVRRFDRGRLIIVNPDDIARTIAPDRINVRIVQLQAARLALAERARLIGEGANLLVETTLSGHSEIALMQDARGAGYKVNLVYVGIGTSNLSMNRVALRVTQGGHDVPDDDARRRFGRTLANLPRAAAIAERVFILDNSGRRPRLLLAAQAGRPPRVAADLPAWLRDAATAPPLADWIAAAPG